MTSIEQGKKLPVVLTIRGEQYYEGVDPDATELMTEGTLEVTEEGLAFFYPMYAIAPAVEGLPTFLLPYGGSLPSPKRDEGA